MEKFEASPLNKENALVGRAGGRGGPGTGVPHLTYLGGREGGR